MAQNSLLKNKIVIVGCGRFGASIANKYSAEGKNVMVIDIHADRFDMLNDNFAGYKFVGDASDISVLKKAHIETAKTVVIASGNDNANILIAHLARKVFDVPEIFIRLDDPDSAVLLKGLQCKTIYPFELSYDEFERLGGVK